ncbi:YjbH domain-containing protein [Belliella sp. R4-6]|uniref:YjbH domain-containing protein n=1 Tax=Belliella alkalica TaxID=1730871 RepID=A0ABS9V6K1_9BACT|nr:YjbH domain-containing protein [Belliella alkalica]MCH7412042.1 YjbH domain-containing protein [Belliella alkalica]
MVILLRFLVFFCVISASLSFELSAQDILSKYEESLIENGFEQVILNASNDKKEFILYFEHRGLRNPLDALKLAKILADEFDVPIKNYIPLHLGVALGNFMYDGKDFVGVDLVDTNKRELSYAYNANKYKFNFYMVPEIQSRFGYFEQPVQSKINWIVGTTFNLGQGFGLHTGILVPLLNNLDNQERNVRLAPTFLSTFSNFLSFHYFTSYTGLFYNDRYGINLQYRYGDPSKLWSLGWELALTGLYVLPSSGFYFEGFNDEMVLVDFEYYFPKEMLTLKVQGGQFMAFDRGVRLDLIRQYGAVDVGFYGVKTQNGTNAGFMFHLPLIPRKLFRSKKIELRMSESFRWSYFFSNEGNIGSRIKSGHMLSDITRQHRHLFIRNQ